jgi:ribonucleotide monophosphatase NagD (HAD superfamily)
METATEDNSSRYRFLNEKEGSYGIRNIVDDYDVFLLDMWGVMHDGIKPYEGVPEVVQKLKDANKKLIILSNSSKRRANSVKMLKKLGFSDDAFDEIITSGEVAHHLLLYLSEGVPSSWVPQEIPKAFRNLRSSNADTDTGNGKMKLSAFCFGSGDGDEDYLNSCGWALADTIETADLIVARGTFVVRSATDLANKNENEDAYWSAYQNALETAAKSPNPIPMVICNPDKVRPDADKSPMPGTIGVAYQDLLKKSHGEEIFEQDLILSLGKPFSSVYEIALSAIADDININNNNNNNNNSEAIDKSRVVMVGDALETDVTGATVAGIDSVWVINDGIHNQAISEAASLEEGCESVLRGFNESSETTYAQGRKVSPTVVVPHFRW